MYNGKVKHDIRSSMNHCAEKLFRSVSFTIAVLSISFIISFLPVNAFPQTENYDEEWRWVHFTMESGLPSNEIMEIIETSDGTMWAVTAKGTAWYDEFRWNILNEKSGLPEKGSREVLADSFGNVLILIDGKIFYGNANGFKTLPIENVVFFSIFNDKQLLINKDYSLFIFDINTSTVHVFNESWIAGKTYFVFSTNSFTNFLNVKSGLYEWINGKWINVIPSSSYPLSFNTKIKDNSQGDRVVSIPDPIEHRGVWEWQKGHNPKVNRSVNGEYIESLDVDSVGTVMALYQSGFVKTRERNIWRDLVTIKSRVRDATCVKFQSNGDLWLGSERGIFLYRKSITRWDFSKGDYSDLKNRVNEILKTRDNNIWLATDGGLEVIYPNGKKEIVNVIDGKKLTALTGLAEDIHGNIWISSGSVFSGAYRWNGREWKHFLISNGPDSVQIHKIRKDRRGRLWFLGLSKNEPMSDSISGGAFVLENNIFTKWGYKEGLPHSRVYAFAQGTDSALWFGTYVGVSRWKNGRWKHWRVEKELKWGKVFAGDIDDNNYFWFANRANGLCYINDKDQPHYITSTEGIGHDHVWDIKADSAGKLWVSTKGGLSYFDIHNQTWSTFSLKSGLPTLDIWPVFPAGNKVYVGTNGEGLAVLNLDKLEQNPPKIYLEEKRSDVDGLYLKWKALASWGELLPQDVLTRIKFDDQPWSTWTPTREVSMQEFPSGSHSFQIQAKGLFGQYDKQGLAGSFFIPSPWYFQSLFITPISVLFVTVIGLSVAMVKRKRAHAVALRRSEAQFRTVSETTSSAIFIVREGRFLYCNSSMIAISGFEKERFGNFFIEDIVQPDELSLLQSVLEKLRKHPDEKFQLELHVIPREGIVKSLMCTLGTIDYGTYLGILGTAVDITDRRKMENELRESRVHYEELFNRANIMQGELGRLSREVMKVQEDERKRISRELHDEIGQLLTAVTINLEILKRTASTMTYATTLNDTARLVNQVFESVHQFSSELRPTVLDELGFISAVRWYTKNFQERTGIRLYLNIEQNAESLTDDQKAMLYRVVQESLTNVAKHSQAKNVNIDTIMTDSTLTMKIEDNGKGIPIEILMSDGRNGKGLGILGMRERVRIAKGEFIVDSKKGMGTTIRVQIPLNGRQVLH